MAHLALHTRYGPWALVTGAAQGLGAEFAKQLAQAGFNLVLLDINSRSLDEVAEQLRIHNPVEIKTLVVDLCNESFMAEVIAATADLPIHLLVNNAGISKIGEFIPQSQSLLMAQLNVNVRAVLLLTHYWAEKMAAKKKGGIIIVSSGAAELPSAFNAAYSASKAYELKLAESLWAELSGQGVDVLGFMPVTTATEGVLSQGYKASAAPRKMMSVEQSVQEALFYLGKRPSVLAGRSNRWLTQLLFLLVPKKQRIRLVGEQIRQMFGLSH